MALYSYAKDYKSAEVDLIPTQKEKQIILEKPLPKKDITLWSSTTQSYDFLQKLVDASKITNIVIPLIFVSIGLFFIYKHISPEIKHTIEKHNGLVAQGTTTPVSDNYIDLSKYISNPAGLAEFSEEAFNQHILQEDTISKNYRGTFTISIPALDIESIPITANVDSTAESAYMSVLNYSLAHFQNTGLPISEVENNIVIYGHSASPNYGPQASDPMVAFSFLPNLKVGDDIYIDMEGQRYHFKMQRSKIVEPSDVSIITGTKGKRTLTLFTCYPIGNNSHRYVAIARQV